MPMLSAATLLPIVQSMFEAAGVPAADAAVVAHSLVDANLCGHDSHGVMRVPQYVEFLKKGTYKAGVPLTVLNETPAVVAADGNWGLGQVQAHRLLGHLIPKAKALGVAAGTLRNCGHTGRLGEYAEFAAKEHMALFATVNSHGSGRRVAPPGGATRRPAPCEFTAPKNASRTRAAASAYSPSRPVWPQFRRVPAATPRACAFGISLPSRRWACTWPSPQLPSATTTAGVSLTTVSGTPAR